jgi:N-acetylmuramoyl-L-alanine amidase
LATAKLSRAAAAGLLSLTLATPLFAADAAALVKSRDSRVLFETAGQLLVELQSKPPAERTRTDYTQVIEAYREVYHVAPASVRADPSAYAVAQLTEELGHRFHDTAVLQQAVKQYRFLLRGYPATKHYAESLFAIGNIESEDLNDREAARESYQELLRRFPADKNAGEAQAKLDGLDALAEGKPMVAASAPKASPAVRESEPFRSSSPLVRSDTDAKPETKTELTAQPTQPDTPVIIKGVRHWSTSEYTRIAIDLNQQVKYEVGEVPGPERVFFDLADAKILAGPAGKTFEIDDGLVRRVRVALFKPHVTRVVVELSAPADYTPFMLPNPWRIMIEVRPRQPGVNTARKSGTPIVAEPFTLPGGTPGSAAQPARKPGADESMVVVVPMKNGTASAKAGPAPVKTNTTEAAATRETHISPATATDAPRASASVPESSPSRIGKTSAATEAADSPAAAHKTTVVAGPAGGYSARSREAQPTSTGERSLTRALGLKIGRIVIDAGHGGHDTGAIGPTGYREKDLVLDVALRLGKLLERKMGAEVIYTRDDDTFIPLEERTNIANQAGADLFLSIHANFSSDTLARGVETYYLNFSASDEALEVAARENATSQKTVHELQDLVQNIALKEKIDESREFAADVQHALWQGEVAKAPGIRNRGVKKAPFIVLIGAHMPSVLAEISFVSNVSDERRLRTPEYRQRIAESLYRGISHYAGGLSGVKFAASSPYKPSGQTVAGTPAHNP